MSISTHHVYRGFAVRFDEIEPVNSITMRRATWNALEQLESGSEDKLAQRYQVKAKPRLVDGKLTTHEFAASDEPESSFGTKHEAEVRARVLQFAGYHTAIIEPTEAAPVRGRYIVKSQLTPTTAPIEDSTHDTIEAAGKRAEEIEDADPEHVATVVDSNSGQVVGPDYVRTRPPSAEERAAAGYKDPDPEAAARMARGEYFGDFNGHTQKWFKADHTLADDQVSDLPEDHVQEVPLPEHPVLDNEPPAAVEEHHEG